MTRIDGVEVVLSSAQRRDKRPEKRARRAYDKGLVDTAAATSISAPRVRPRRQPVGRRVPRVAVPLVWYFFTSDIRHITWQRGSFRLELVVDDQTPYL